MGNRLSKLYTRTGDDGTSGLSGGERVAKNHARMHAMGSVDELNSLLGLLICKLDDAALTELLTAIQHDLFNIGGEISMPGQSFITADKVARLEQRIDEFNTQVEPLKDFILPGGSEAAAICHMARAVARRAERDLISLHQLEPVCDTTRQYLNRLSDLLFVAARIINQALGQPDVLWKKELA
ncbi:ATP--cobalamin adenosyltransferase [Arenicella chitinivorans]|uniref:Corrinoid adenosyltransferase n=1 Tax=Arenicella chitinivorans TaxID=1329800 RepID=A0A918S010_9GAMM|nr:cob(I)yrinic acid a,c-diamide adenosyltransferase [Arenicella chitinivorans]GHA17191.1 ATP--cobalamin adenosyltransferase [Arenicella chitinivorans]